MTRAFVFPGQGSQAVGMGQDLAAAFPEARETFEEIDEALEQHLSRLMAEGPADELTRTANAQPAIMAVSLAALRVLIRQGGLSVADTVSHAAGHSLGEYAALAAAGTLDVAATARLLRTRGRAMQGAVPEGEGAMAALIGLELDAVRAVAEEASAAGVCEIANDNAPGQVVVSGHRAAVERAMEGAKARRAKRAMELPVSAPFHCRLMQPAAETMRGQLDATAMADPAVPVVANVTAAPEREADALRENLVTQVTHTVRWRESVAAMREAGVTQLIELGHGTTLTGLSRRIDRQLAARAVGGPRDVETVVEMLR